MSTVIIAFGASPTSLDVLEAGVRYARSAGSNVIACSVRYRHSYRETQPDQLSKNARHASDLGAEVVHVEGHRIAEQIVQVARERGAGTIVVGRSPGYSWILPWRRNVGDRIHRVAHDILVLVVAPPNGPRERPEPARRSVITTIPDRIARRWVSVVLIMGSAVGLSMWVDGLARRDAITIMILLAGVLFSATIGTRASGLVSAGLAVLSFNFFFTEPRFTFVVDDPGYLITFPVMFVVAFVTSELTSRLNASVALARTRQDRAETLYRYSEQLLSARGVETIRTVVTANLERLLKRDVVLRLRMDPPEGTGEKPTGESLSRYGTTVEIATDTRRFGTITVNDTATPLSVGSVALVNAIAAQLAIALDRERLTRAEESARLHAERERVRANLLRSVSHDLRTPLAAIAGSAQTLRETGGIPGPYRNLVVDIEADAMWLSDMVENILSLTRMNEETLPLHTAGEVLEELLQEAIERTSRRTRSERFVLELPDEIIVVDVDTSLVEQLLMNVLGNAVDYSPPGEIVAVSVAMDGDHRASISVRDRGPGIPEDELDRVFDLFYTRKTRGDSRRGLGVGLTVARTVAELHGGSIDLRNAESGGLIVTIKLPARTAALPDEEP